ncbi:MAG: hypothetical protein ACUZ8E_14905 [Candidatus Anammoxibacter sp.]
MQVKLFLSSKDVPPEPVSITKKNALINLIVIIVVAAFPWELGRVAMGGEVVVEHNAPLLTVRSNQTSLHEVIEEISRVLDFEVKLPASSAEEVLMTTELSSTPKAVLRRLLRDHDYVLIENSDHTSSRRKPFVSLLILEQVDALTIATRVSVTSSGTTSKLAPKPVPNGASHGNSRASSYSGARPLNVETWGTSQMDQTENLTSIETGLQVSTMMRIRAVGLTATGMLDSSDNILTGLVPASLPLDETMRNTTIQAANNVKALVEALRDVTASMQAEGTIP